VNSPNDKKKLTKENVNNDMAEAKQLGEKEDKEFAQKSKQKDSGNCLAF